MAFAAGFLFFLFSDLYNFIGLVSLCKEVFDDIRKEQLVFSDDINERMGHGVLGHEDGAAVLIGKDRGFIGVYLL